MKALVVSIPRLQTHKKYKKQKIIHNDVIREVLKRSSYERAKVIAIDLGLNDYNVYAIKNNYKLIDNELYKRIKWWQLMTLLAII